MTLIAATLAFGPLFAQMPDAVVAYADTLIAHGRDHYGDEESPMFAAGMNRAENTLLQGDALTLAMAMERSDWGIRPHDRALTGANPMHDENLYQVLYALTEITGDAKYATAADDALRYFWTHCQSPGTGLMAWGEHIGWDFRSDARIEKQANNTHEYFRPWVLWDPSYALAPEACLTFARGVWKHQIADHETGNFSRHAQWDAHGPGTNSEYPRHGGFYIRTWADAYEKTKDPVYLEAIGTVLQRFTSRRNAETGVIPSESAVRSKNTLCWASSNVSLCIDLSYAAERVPEALADAIRAVAAQQDALYLQMPHDLSTGGSGFVSLVDCATLGKERKSFTHDWATGYGDATHAMIANLCALRYDQNQDAGFKNLVVACADRYLGREPDRSIHLYPGTFGDLIWLMLNAYAYTGDVKYRVEAKRYAAMVPELFLDGSPLPSASSQSSHYEAITRADTLMMALLRLWCVENGKESVGETLVYTDR